MSSQSGSDDPADRGVRDSLAGTGAGTGTGTPRVPGYRLLEPIGVGGSGAVWRAEGDDALARAFAVKVFPQRGEAYERELATLSAIEEVRAQAGSRDLVEVVGAGEVGELGYVVMEYVAGGSLARRLDAEGPLPAREAVELLLPALRALELLHGAGLVHKDVTPANVLVGEDGRARLGDFGLARRSDAPVSSAGTPGFCAPELYAGAEGAALDAARVDVYSAAATLYALLCGLAPLPGRPDLFLLERRRVDRDLQRLLFEALAEEPARRTASARALREALEGWLRGEPPPPPAPAPGPASPPRPRVRWERPLLGLGLLLLAVGAFFLLGRMRAAGPLLWDGAHLTPVGPAVRWERGAAWIQGLGRIDLLDAAPADWSLDARGATLAAIGPWGEAVVALLSPPAPQVLLRVPGLEPGAGEPPLCAVACDGRHLARVIAPLEPGRPARVEVFALGSSSREPVLVREDLPPAPALALWTPPGQALPTLLLGGPDGCVRLVPPQGPVVQQSTHADEVRALALDAARAWLYVAGDERALERSSGGSSSEAASERVVVGGHSLARTPRLELKVYALTEGGLSAQPVWTRPLAALRVLRDALPPPREVE
ncbi:MAG: protein kinase [Planctomycetota bacterium]